MPQAGDGALPDRIDGRIGDLRKGMFEIIVEPAGHARDDGRRRIIPHGTQWLASAFGHGHQVAIEVFPAPAQGGQGGRVDAGTGFREIAELIGVIAPRNDLEGVGDQPGIRRPARHFRLDSGILHETPAIQAKGKQFAGHHVVMERQVFGRHIHDAGLRCHHNQTVLGDGVAQGAQPVPVHLGAHVVAVGDHQRRRAIPRFHEIFMVDIKIAQGGIHAGILLVRLRQQHHQAAKHSPATAHEKFQHIVQAVGIAAVIGHDGPEGLQIRPPELRLHFPLPGLHPQAVAFDRIDFPIVRQHAERLGHVPVGQRIRGEPFMKQGHLGQIAGFQQVGVETVQVFRFHQPLVDNGARRKGTYKRIPLPVEFALDSLPDQEQFALNRTFDARRGYQENLNNQRAGRPRLLAQDLAIDWNLPCAQKFDPRLGSVLAEGRQQGLLVFHGGEYHANGEGVVILDFIATRFLHEPRKQGLGNVGHDAATVPGFIVSALGAAMGQTGRRLQGQGQHPAARDSGNLSDEAGTAGVVLLAGVVEREACFFECEHRLRIVIE